jgi:hypothetical protein
MAVEGDTLEALALFEQAWSARRDDFDACIAAHFVARHQATPEATLHWNAIAVRHAKAVPDHRADEFMASLYLNLGDACANVGDHQAAVAAAAEARTHLTAVTVGGYRDFVEYGITRLERRLTVRSAELATSQPHADASIPSSRE